MRDKLFTADKAEEEEAARGGEERRARYSWCCPIWLCSGSFIRESFVASNATCVEFNQPRLHVTLWEKGVWKSRTSWQTSNINEIYIGSIIVGLYCYKDWIISHKILDSFFHISWSIYITIYIRTLFFFSYGFVGPFSVCVLSLYLFKSCSNTTDVFLSCPFHQCCINVDLCGEVHIPECFLETGCRILSYKFRVFIILSVKPNCNDIF